MNYNLKLFHVERTLLTTINKGKMLFFFLLFVFCSCGTMKPNVQISDYILVPNGKEILENKGLTAFIFENNKRQIPIEQYISWKLNVDSYNQNEFWVSIDNQKYKLIIYDFTEFEKYFNSSNYSVINLEPSNVVIQDKRDFIAISMINSYNEDCLADGSLYQNMAVKYLKKLKDEYYNQ